MPTLDATLRPSGAVRVRVQVKPRASRSAMLGVREDGALVVALAAPPVEGEANRELVRLLAAALGVPRGAVSIATGERGRHKLIDVEGLELEEVCARVERACAGV